MGDGMFVVKFRDGDETPFFLSKHLHRATCLRVFRHVPFSAIDQGGTRLDESFPPLTY